MNFLRLRPLAQSALRSRPYNTSVPFIPPSSLDAVDHSYPTASLRPKPESPTFYTGRSEYYDTIQTLEIALKEAQMRLRAAHLFPFPEAARAHLPPAFVTWKNKGELGATLGLSLTTARHRKATAILAQMNELRRIALAGGEDGIAQDLRGFLSKFERPNTMLQLSRGKRAVADEYGRTYALGRRKESSARVWMIPVKTAPAPPVAAADSQQAPQNVSEQGAPAQEHKLDLTSTSPAPSPSPAPPAHLASSGESLPTTAILVNNLPLATYFPNAVDRQRVVRPFKLAGVFGAFNVFAIVRGGGTTGQAGAVAHGIAKNIAAHVPEMEIVLRRAKVLKRDPRMVERKKPGLAKARKRYAWVKR
ncbi:ribosomal protein S9/S16-domain-containing protein [Hysterangium stoloniferum]|nr:ribosomal protein S9/S16-domain-containing protein [Hysterangium stoloniferum]